MRNDEPGQSELVAELRSQVEWLRREVERKDTIIMSLTQRVPELEPASEPQNRPEAAAEGTANGAGPPGIEPVLTAAEAEEEMNSLRPGRFSGFGVALWFIICSAIWILAPQYYLGVSADSGVTVGFYIFALLALVIGAIGFLVEATKRSVRRFLGTLIVGNVPGPLWGSLNTEILKNATITLVLALPSGLIHFIVVWLLGATGTVELVAKIVAVLLMVLPAMGLAATIDELAIKPLIMVPAIRLASGQFEARPRTSRTTITSRIRGLVARLVAIVIVTGEFVAGLTGIIGLIRAILG